MMPMAPLTSFSSSRRKLRSCRVSMMLEGEAADAVAFTVMLRLSKPSMRVTFVDDIVLLVPDAAISEHRMPSCWRCFCDGGPARRNVVSINKRLAL